MMENSFKKLTDFSKTLRKECIWHDCQTFHSFADKISEETGEVIEAIENNDAENLKEELGDLLWDVLFMIHIAEDNGLFDIKSVLDDTLEKIKRRNPHINEEWGRDYNKVMEMYRGIKAAEKQQPGKYKKIISFPSIKKCIGLWDEFELPVNIRKHSFQVARVAVALAKKINEKNILVNTGLLRAAALLHDIDKISTLNNNLNHGKKTREFLKNKGYGFLGALIEKHSFPMHISRFVSWEEKLLFYADQWVQDDKLTLPDERIKQSKLRYPDVADMIENNGKIVKKIEKELFEITGLKQDEIMDLIKKDKDAELNKVEVFLK